MKIGLAFGAGVLLALSVPPVGWWPLAFAGIALLDHAVDGAPAWSRFRRTGLAMAALFLPTLFWMQFLTLPGYFVAVGLYSAMFATAMALCPPTRTARWIALPGLWTLVEAARGRWPYGGQPLSTLAQGQIGGPLAPIVRLGGPLLLIGVTVVAGVAVAAASRRAWRAAGVALAVVLVAVAGAAVAPRGHQVDTLRIALVQGGGPTGHRDVEDDDSLVFERHLDESAHVETPVDLVVWPEDVVDTDGAVTDNPEGGELSALARRLDATLVVGVVESEPDGRFHNAAQVFLPDGSVGERYEKVHRVPFGEYTPMRSILERIAPDALVRGEAIPGHGHGVLATPVGKLGVVISWEVFFADRARDAIAHGGRILLNPTNGATFRGTEVQSQQLASSRLRALETGRWVVQVAPTGYSAVITPDGHVVAKTKIGKATVVQRTVGLRTGLTIANRVGDWPAAILAVVLIAVGWWAERRQRSRTTNSVSDSPGVATTSS
jgi:apolipoprotein N-acyltransferase